MAQCTRCGGVFQQYKAVTFIEHIARLAGNEADQSYMDPENLAKKANRKTTLPPHSWIILFKPLKFQRFF